MIVLRIEDYCHNCVRFVPKYAVRGIGDKMDIVVYCKDDKHCSYLVEQLKKGDK